MHIRSVRFLFTFPQAGACTGGFSCILKLISQLGRSSGFGCQAIGLGLRPGLWKTNGKSSSALSL